MSEHKTEFIEALNQYKTLFTAEQAKCILMIYDLATENETIKYLKFCNWMKTLTPKNDNYGK